MTGPLRALEGSLRDGPPDETGYRPRPLDFATASPREQARGVVQVGPVVSGRSTRRSGLGSSWQALAAIIVVAVGLAALGILNESRHGVVGGPSPSPTASRATRPPSPSVLPSPAPAESSIPVPPLSEAFASTRNGFSVRYPAGWTVRPATASWPPDIFLTGSHPAFDILEGPGVARLRVASQPLGAGQTEATWLAAFFDPYVGAGPCGNIEASRWPRLRIGDVDGYLDAASLDDPDCPTPADGGRVSARDVRYVAYAFAGGRVYQFAINGDIDLAYLRALLATVELLPSMAIDEPAPS